MVKIAPPLRMWPSLIPNLNQRKTKVFPAWITSSLPKTWLSNIAILLVNSAYKQERRDRVTSLGALQKPHPNVRIVLECANRTRRCTRDEVPPCLQHPSMHSPLLVSLYTHRTTCSTHSCANGVCLASKKAHNPRKLSTWKFTYIKNLSL